MYIFEYEINLSKYFLPRSNIVGKMFDVVLSPHAALSVKMGELKVPKYYPLFFEWGRRIKVIVVIFNEYPKMEKEILERGLLPLITTVEGEAKIEYFFLGSKN